jgi:hypothetical protein
MIRKYNQVNNKGIDDGDDVDDDEGGDRCGSLQDPVPFLLLCGGDGGDIAEAEEWQGSALEAHVFCVLDG